MSNASAELRPRRREVVLRARIRSSLSIVLTPSEMNWLSAQHGKRVRAIRGRVGDLVYGYVSTIGQRREMEDAVTVAPPGWLKGDHYYFFAVYDGHGGADVADKCGKRMHLCLEKEIEKAKQAFGVSGFEWEKVMEECFSSMDEEIGSAADHGDVVSMMGSTALVVLVGKDDVVVANCGDSRAVLYRGGMVVPLSMDHKPDRQDERERIEAAGGRIMRWDGWRVEGILAKSRSLGDRYLKPYMISEPEVTVVRRSDADHFLIIASDGLFNVISNEDACSLVSNSLRSRRKSSTHAAAEAAILLAEVAKAKGSSDNISVIIVGLS